MQYKHEVTTAGWYHTFTPDHAEWSLMISWHAGQDGSWSIAATVCACNYTHRQVLGSFEGYPRRSIDALVVMITNTAQLAWREMWNAEWDAELQAAIADSFRQDNDKFGWFPKADI